MDQRRTHDLSDVVQPKHIIPVILSEELLIRLTPWSFHLFLHFHVYLGEIIEDHDTVLNDHREEHDSDQHEEEITSPVTDSNEPEQLTRRSVTPKREPKCLQ